MGQALYRKYRSKTLADVIGQDHITKTLAGALKNRKINHAYLFTGPRGVGKTSVARILAHEINGLPYNEVDNHIDIIEIDAASNRRIDEIRELRESAYIAPTSAKYKVYIIDEVHMLTNEAFNALLKLLEEPPAHVIFILATTDAHKLPDTIISRTQRYSFKPASVKDIITVLENVAKSEHIEASPEVLNLIAEHGSGSYRDSIGLLDQASNQSNSLSEQGILQLLGIPSKQVIESLYESLTAETDNSSVIIHLNELIDQGYQSTIIAKSLTALIRDKIISNQFNGRDDEGLALLSDLILVTASYEPDRALEIALLKYKMQNYKAKSTTTAPDNKNVNEQNTYIHVSTNSISSNEKNKIKSVESEIKPTTTVKKDQEIISKQEANAPIDISSVSIDEFWPNVLTALKQKYNTLYGIVRMAQPSSVGENELELHFKFSFHQKRVMESKNQQLLRSIVKELTGRDYAISCVTDKAISNKSPTKEQTDTPKLQDDAEFIAISNIFGGGELLES